MLARTSLLAACAAAARRWRVWASDLLSLRVRGKLSESGEKVSSVLAVLLIGDVVESEGSWSIEVMPGCSAIEI